MVKYLFSVYDSKARTYCNPFTAINQAVAIRDFTQAAHDPASHINKFPTDYTLVELGEYDDENATMNLHQNPVVLGLASNYLEL
ncbi:MAG: nonstructural protein [Microviridae sp.]|nr:MAG: nonstructural protein [Microviridae sp.]